MSVFSAVADAKPRAAHADMSVGKYCDCGVFLHMNTCSFSDTFLTVVMPGGFLLMAPLSLLIG